MYQGLMYAVKRRMIDEVENGFQEHPAFSEKVKVYNKYPYKERVQYGVVFRNASASQLRLSADNYMAEYVSHVRLAKQGTHPGLSIEWARENPRAVTLYHTEDESSKVDPTQRMFKTDYPILAGPGNTAYATNMGQITVTLDGVKTLPEYVNGEKGIVMLRQAPASGTKVVAQYWRRNIAPPGVFVIDFVEDDQFTVQPIYLVRKEVVIESTTGTEVTAQLANSGATQHISLGSETLTLKFGTNGTTRTLVRGVDYTAEETTVGDVTYLTGLITFLLPLPRGYKLLADYLWQPTDFVNGPHQFNAYTENHEVVPGVILSIGRRAKKGDQQAVVVSQFREDQARIFGGHWTMNLDLQIIAKDPLQMEEMTDHVVYWLWTVRKNILEFEGLTLNSVEPTGESEEVYIESTGDQYYEQSVSVNIQTEWQEFVPYVYEIRDVVPGIQFFPGGKNYTVGDDLKVTLDALKPDARPVVVYPMIGYERLEPGLPGS